MNIRGLVPGYRYIYATDDPNRFVVLVTTKVLGFVPVREDRWVLDKRDSESFITCLSELLVKLPFVQAQNGTVALVEREVQRLQYPELYAALNQDDFGS